MNKEEYNERKKTIDKIKYIAMMLASCYTAKNLTLELNIDRTKSSCKMNVKEYNV